MSGKYGLLGERLGHSYSPKIHAKLADYEYSLYEVEKERVAAFLEETELSGMNVTIPYKKTVMASCAYLSETARRMGCVNTLVKKPDGWYGYNTDYYGFWSLVKVSGIDPEGKKVLVLGSGGASNTVCRAMEDLGASEVIVISRSGENNYGNLEKHRDAGVIVNATPVGMFPSNGESPVDLKLFPGIEGVLDVIYNPARTALLLQAEELGIRNAGGLYMLTAQAKKSCELFTGSTINDDVIAEITDSLDRESENIILIGMPGSGKSSIGRETAKLLGRQFIDADEEIVKTAGKSIPEIFAERGEAGFREIETEVLRDLGKRSGTVLATGGGCVTRQENYPLLHQNGRIIWIRRALEMLPSDGRPVSMSNPVEKLYEQRKNAYEAFSDYVIDNDSQVCAAAEKIVKILEEV